MGKSFLYFTKCLQGLKSFCSIKKEVIEFKELLFNLQSQENFTANFVGWL